jgi:tyrosinase
MAATIESYRRAVGVMMARDAADRTGWLFQASMVGSGASEIVSVREAAARYWRQNPRKNYFFLSWQRMHLYFFERILRRAASDPMLALPYWAYDEPAQRALPVPFRPDADQEDVSPPMRRNALARSVRHPPFERGALMLGDTAGASAAALAVERFSAVDPLDPRGSFGGPPVVEPGRRASPGAIEALHNRFHLMTGPAGDLASPTSAARDPVYWLHAANIDRLWVKWTARHGIAPMDDAVWMKTPFTFVDENGDDRVMTGADVLDTQSQLGYRYDDDPPRGQRLELKTVATVPPRPEPVVLARATDIDLAARETAVVLAPVPPPRRPPPVKAAKGAPRPVPRMRIVLRDVVVADRTPAYDLFLVLEGLNVFEPTTTSVPIGALELFGATGDNRAAETIAFDATDAMAKLARVRGFHPRHLRIVIVRRPLPDGAGVDAVPPDMTPPEIGAIELVRA